MGKKKTNSHQGIVVMREMCILPAALPLDFHEMFKLTFDKNSCVKLKCSNVALLRYFLIRGYGGFICW